MKDPLKFAENVANQILREASREIPKDLLPLVGASIFDINEVIDSGTGLSEHGAVNTPEDVMRLLSEINGEPMEDYAYAKALLIAKQQKLIKQVWKEDEFDDEFDDEDFDDDEEFEDDEFEDSPQPATSTEEYPFHQDGSLDHQHYTLLMKYPFEIDTSY